MTQVENESMIFREADLPLEVAILAIGGMVMLITGTILFMVSAGTLPYYENGLYGLLLLMEVFLMLPDLLLIPVNLGLLPFLGSLPLT